MLDATANVQREVQPPLKVFTLKDLREVPEESHSWVVEGLLPTAGSSLLVGKPKTGKSTLARQLAFAVSTGRPFLGRDVLQGPVLYLALEEKKSEVWKQFELLGADGTEPISVVFDYHGNRMDEVRDLIALIKPVLVVVDTLAKFLDLREINKYGPTNNRLRELHELARNSGAHLLCVHHSRKGVSDDAIDNVLGSTALSGGVDTVIAIQNHRGKRTLSTLQRYGVSIDETILDFDPETRTSSILGTTKDIAEEAKRGTLLVLSKNIVEFVTNHPGCTEAAIILGVTGKKEAKVTQLRELLKDRLRREGGGKAGNAYRYYADVPVEVENTR
jgi:hypothetical protein